MREGLPPVDKPPPFPYKEKRYNFFRALFDPTTSRLDENSKLIVVEGPPAAGKGVLAKELADDLGMAYFPSPTVAENYINDYGYDVRQLDDQLPESCKSYDENDFLKDPMRLNGSKAARFQLSKLALRYKCYLEALAHILNTGQGVVMDRSPYSDLVYITAMAEVGIVSKNGKKFCAFHFNRRIIKDNFISCFTQYTTIIIVSETMHYSPFGALIWSSIWTSPLLKQNAKLRLGIDHTKRIRKWPLRNTFKAWSIPTKKTS